MSAFVCPWCFKEQKAKGFFFKAPEKCVCGKETHKSFREAPNLRITVVGAKGSGKTHFFTLLIRRIREIVAAQGGYLHGLNDHTLAYGNDKYKQLAEGDERGVRATIESTNKGTIEPLHYDLTLGKKSVALAFADTAGEALVNEKEVGRIGDYMLNASAIICIIDPLQLPSVRRALIASGIPEEDLPDVEAETGTILNRICLILRKRLRSGERSKIPLAIAFSKIDALQQGDEIAKGVHGMLAEESRHCGGFNEAQFTAINNTMCSWLQDVDNTADILNQSNAFERVGFFGFSALGQNPGRRQELTRALRPIRVEDPFLWLLNRNGFVRTIR